MRRTIACVAACLIAGSAKADWQYTSWGMTPSQVMAASGGLAKPISDPGKNGEGFKTLLMAPYEGNGLRFSANFRFLDTTGKLDTVTLELADQSKCPVLMHSLSSAYGPAQDRSRSSVTRTEKWWDRERGNVITYMEIVGTCEVQYRPIGQRGGQGGL